VTAQEAGPTAKALAQPHVRLTIEMLLLLVGAQLCLGLPLPWRVAGLVFSLLALVQGVRAIRALRAHRRTHPDVLAFGPAGGILLGLAVGVAAALTLLQVAMLALSPVLLDLERCQDRALTRIAMDRCQEQLVERLEELTGVSAP
jgi:prepilin signal peptidase PulO-like enzyme (type II secretory pathway)